MNFVNWLQILFLLGPAALSCLLAVTGYGYAHLNMDDTLAFLQKHYRVSFDDSNQVLEVSIMKL